MPLFHHSSLPDAHRREPEPCCGPCPADPTLHRRDSQCGHRRPGTNPTGTGHRRWRRRHWWRSTPPTPRADAVPPGPNDPVPSGLRPYRRRTGRPVAHRHRCERRFGPVQTPRGLRPGRRPRRHVHRPTSRYEHCDPTAPDREDGWHHRGVGRCHGHSRRCAGRPPSAATGSRRRDRGRRGARPQHRPRPRPAGVRSSRGSPRVRRWDRPPPKPRWWHAVPTDRERSTGLLRRGGPLRNARKAMRCDRAR